MYYIPYTFFFLSISYFHQNLCLARSTTKRKTGKKENKRTNEMIKMNNMLIPYEHCSMLDRLFIHYKSCQFLVFICFRHHFVDLSHHVDLIRDSHVQYVLVLNIGNNCHRRDYHLQIGILF